MPEECYQDLRQECGWDFLVDHMLEMLLTCGKCGRDSEVLVPGGNGEAKDAAWTCPQCRKTESQ